MIGLKKDININLLTKTKYVFLKNKSRKKKITYFKERNTANKTICTKYKILWLI